MPVSDETINTLVEAVRRISSSLDLDEVLDTILDSLKQLIDYSAAVVCVVEPTTGVVNGLKVRGYPGHMPREAFVETGHGIIGWAIENKRGVFVNDVREDTRYVRARTETVSEVAAPIIRGDGEVIGAINLESDQADSYGERDVQLLSMFASLAGSAIEQTLLHARVVQQHMAETELELARTVVDSLLPRSFPSLEGFDIFGMTIPVRQVGGDYFDFFDALTDRFGVLIADVSGKGLAAALIMVSFRAHIHATVLNEFAMRVVMARVNSLVYNTTQGDRFITTFYGLIDPLHKRLLYINAGHNPPLLLHADGTRELLEEAGLPLGIFEDSRYSESVVNFRKSDLLVLYTDGVTEATNAADDAFGLDRLEQVVRAESNKSSLEICAVIAAAVRDFSAGSGGPADDLTVLVIKVK